MSNKKSKERKKKRDNIIFCVLLFGGFATFTLCAGIYSTGVENTFKCLGVSVFLFVVFIGIGIGNK